MIGIKINGEFLDMPGVSIQLEEQSPFLQFTDEIKGAHSLPFEIPVTERNLRLLNYVTSVHAKKVLKYDAICYDNDSQHSVGYLIVELTKSNLNSYKDGTISCYYLLSSSYFYQDVKDKKLNTLDWGGERFFSHGSDRLTQSAFWKHLVDAASGNVDNFDYTFFPVRNDSWTNEDGRYSVRGVNNWILKDGEWKFSEYNSYIKNSGEGLPLANPICPFLYLKYILKNIFSQLGWTIIGDILEDPDFKKITILSFRDIFYGYFFYNANVRQHANSVSFNLKNYLPDVTITEFIISIKNKLGISFDFNRTKKECTLTWLVNIIDNSNFDITRYVERLFSTSFEQVKRYSINQTNSDSGAVPETEILKGDKITINDLPLANSNTEGHVFFIQNLNAWYSCVQKENGTYIWEKWGDNNGNYEQPDETDSIPTDTSTCTMVQELLQDSRYLNELYGVFPKVDHPGYWQVYNETPTTWGVHLAFYRGMRRSIDGKSYPFATNNIMSPTGEIIGNWALTFNFLINGVNYGIYDKFYKRFFDTLDDSEVLTVQAVMPRHVYEALKFASSVVINHSTFFIRKKKSSIPFNEKVDLELVKA